MIIKFFFVLLGAAILVSFVFCVSRLRADAPIYFASYLLVIGNALFPQWLFQGLEKMRLISLISGIAKIAAATSIIIFVHRADQVLLASILQPSGMVLGGATGLVIACRQYIKKVHVPTWADIRSALVDGRHLFLTTAAVSLYTNTNTFLVGAIAGDSQAGYFSLADKLIRAIMGLTNPVMQAAYPHTVRLISEGKERAIQFVQRLIACGAVVGVIAGIVLLVLAKPLARIAFHLNPSPEIPIIRTLSLFPLCALISSTLGVQVLIPFGFDAKQSRFLVAAGLINLAMGSFLVWRFQAIGAVISMTFIEAFLIVGNLAILSRGNVRLFSPARSAG